MKTVLFVAFTALFGAPVFAVTSEIKMPVISAETFPLGKSWVWKYHEDGVLYSTEKYTVIMNEPGKVVFEMTTRIGQEQNFSAHHRLEVDIEKCLAAYKNPNVLKPWSLKLYFWDKDRWSLITGLNKTLAFEEKFNCDPHFRKQMYLKTLLKTEDTDLGPQEIFSNSKHKNIEASWFFLKTEHAGVMAFKNMSHNYDKVKYTVQFSVTD